MWDKHLLLITCLILILHSVFIFCIIFLVPVSKVVHFPHFCVSNSQLLMMRTKIGVWKVSSVNDTLVCLFVFLRTQWRGYFLPVPRRRMPGWGIMFIVSWLCGGWAWPTGRTQTEMKTRPKPTNWSRCVCNRQWKGVQKGLKCTAVPVCSVCYVWLNILVANFCCTLNFRRSQ